MRRRRSRARAVVGIIGAMVGALLTFVIAIAAAAVLHLNVPSTRRLVATRVNAFLVEQFAGVVAIERIEGLGLRGVDGVRLRVKDPDGVQVLYVDGARVRVRSFEAVRSLIFGKSDIAVTVDGASVAQVDASVDSDAAGKLRLARAFASHSPTPSRPKDPNARGVRVDAPSVRLTHAWVHGRPPGAPTLDADLDDLVARGHYDSKLLRADLERVDVHARGLPRAVDPKGLVVAHLAMPSSTGASLGVEGAFAGQVAGISTAMRASLDGQKVDAVIDGRDASGQGMRATFGEIAIQQELTLHAEAHGELPKVAARANARLGRATADLVGTVDLSDGTRADARLAVRHADLRAIVPSAPGSDVGLEARASVVVSKHGAVTASGSVDTVAGTIAGQALPVLHAQGEVADGVGRAVGSVVDPRGNADFVVTSQNTGTGPVLEGELHVEVPDLSLLPEIAGGPITGHALVSAEGTADLGKKRLAARAHVTGGDLSYGAHSVEDVTVVASAEGTPQHPLVDVGVHASTIASGAQKVGVAEVRARVEPGAVTTFRDAHVDLVKDGVTLGASAERVEVVGSRVLVEGALVTGLGEPIHADFSRTESEIRMKVDAPSIDLERAAALAGRPQSVRSGRLALDGEVVLVRSSVTGAVHARVESLSTEKLEGGSMKLDAAFDGKHLGLDVSAELADAGTFRLATKGIVIDGSPLEMSSWKRASGRAKFDSRFDMGKVAAMLPEELVPFSELRGAGRVSGTVRRDSAYVPPELAVHFDTRGLVVGLGGKHEPPHDVQHDERVAGVQPWRSEGVDLSLDARVDATSGAGEIALHAVDRAGTVAAFDVKADLPYQEVLAAPSRAAELLAHAPLSARLVVPKRALSEMPRLAGYRTMNGTFEAEATCVGTALEPQVDLVAHARGLRSAVLSDKLASDVDVGFRYDGERGDLVASASSEKRRVLELSAHVDLRSRDLVLTPGRPLEWTGSAVMKLAAFPLESLGPLAARRVRGLVSGQASLLDLHRDAKVHAELAFDRLKVGRAEFKSGRVALDTRAGKLEASARLEQTDGYADLRATTDLAWGATLAPSVDADAKIDARLDAKAFRAAALLPFVKPAFNELDGRIDANVTAKIGMGREEDAALRGKVVFRDGTVQLAAFAEELKEARATATFQPGGVIAIDDVLMRASDGELSAKGVVRTRGLALASASASLHIPDRKELDVSLQGRPIGAFAGDVELEATSSDDGKLLRVAVDVPKMKVTLPQQLKSGVQDLEAKETIRVGTFRDERTFVRLPLDKQDLMPEGAPEEPGTVIEGDIRLGDITITQGNLVSMVVGGKPHVRIAETTEVSGQIQVKQGKIDVQGKRFEIERGTATFNPQDPSNPTVVATAAWTADDGTKVFADFVGPVRTGKVTLRSDPGRPQNEILAMILFGTADGANAAPPPPGRAPDGTTRAATALGGAFAARGLTEAMDDLTGIQATARIDTTRSANPAPEIEIQIARRVSIAFMHILGTPPLSEPDTNLAIVSWRVGKNWSLAATVGDRGKVQSDAIWTKRY